MSNRSRGSLYALQKAVIESVSLAEMILRLWGLRIVRNTEVVQIFLEAVLRGQAGITQIAAFRRTLLQAAIIEQPDIILSVSEGSRFGIRQ